MRSKSREFNEGSQVFCLALLVLSGALPVAAQDYDTRCGIITGDTEVTSRIMSQARPLPITNEDRKWIMKSLRKGERYIPGPVPGYISNPTEEPVVHRLEMGCGTGGAETICDYRYQGKVWITKQSNPWPVFSYSPEDERQCNIYELQKLRLRLNKKEEAHAK